MTTVQAMSLNGVCWVFFIVYYFINAHFWNVCTVLKVFYTNIQHISVQCWTHPEYISMSRGLDGASAVLDAQVLILDYWSSVVSRLVETLVQSVAESSLSCRELIIHLIFNWPVAFSGGLSCSYLWPQGKISVSSSGVRNHSPYIELCFCAFVRRPSSPVWR